MAAMANSPKKRSNSTDKTNTAKMEGDEDKNFQEMNEFDELFKKEYSKCKEPLECFKKLHSD